MTRERLVVHQGRWSFEEDGTLRCEGKGTSSFLTLRGIRARDVDLSVEVMFLAPDSSAGLVFRSEGERFYGTTTFYQFEWYTRGRHHDRRLSLMTKNPRWKQIVTPILRDPPIGRWIRFRVKAVCDRIEADIDGARVFERSDRTFLRTGRVGLHVFQPREVRFRNLRYEAQGAVGSRAACR